MFSMAFLSLQRRRKDKFEGAPILEQAYVWWVEPFRNVVITYKNIILTVITEIEDFGIYAANLQNKYSFRNNSRQYSQKYVVSNSCKHLLKTTQALNRKNLFLLKQADINGIFLEQMYLWNKDSGDIPITFRSWEATTLITVSLSCRVSL